MIGVKCNCHQGGTSRVMAFQHAPTCPVYQAVVQDPSRVDELSNELKPYTRYTPTDDDRKKAVAIAQRFILQKNRLELIAVFATLLLEQGTLVHEVQDHRRARGFEPLPEKPL
jgi:hypothetical protein